MYCLVCLWVIINTESGTNEVVVYHLLYFYNQTNVKPVFQLQLASKSFGTSKSHRYNCLLNEIRVCWSIIFNKLILVYMTLGISISLISTLF